jgi:predicted ATPase
LTKNRSPFGALLRYHRRQLGLSQARLALRIAAIADEGPSDLDGLLSEKAISNLEAEREPADQVSPRVSTVLILAHALGLERGTPSFDAFLGAATHGHNHVEAPAATLGSQLDQTEPRPLVTAGREVAVGRLNHHLHRALSGAAQIVFVAGDSGIGKTFLINHICRQAVAAHSSLVVTISDANSPAGLGEPYLPFKQMLALLSGDISVATADQLISAEHAARLKSLAVPTAEALIAHGPALIGPFVETDALQRRVHSMAPRDAWWLPVLHRLAEESSARSNASPDQMHEQFARVIIEMAKNRPIVLVLDDLHWADERTCDLLFYLARRLHRLDGTPLLVIGAYRLADLAVREPSARHPLHRVINETQRYWGPIVIDLTNTVGNENGRLFVDAFIDAEPNRLDTSFRSLLFNRTEGHPLFVTELLQWMRDHDILVQDETGSWHVRRDVTFDELPSRIGALMAERFEQLPLELQKTVRAASIQGLSVVAEVVADVRQLSRRQLAGQLEALVADHRLLIPEPMSRAAHGTHRYRFTHSLFREYLEGSLSPYTRQVLHLETAEAILRVLPNPAEAGLDIARHFDLGGETIRACEWYLRAADRNLREFNHESALRWFGHALDLAREADDQTLVCRATIGMGEALRARGDVTAAIRIGLEALEASDLAQNAALRAECLTSLGVFFYDIGSNDQAESYLLEALTLLEHEDQVMSATACAAHYLLSYTLYARGAYTAGVEHAHEALTLARKFNLSREEGECLVSVAYYHVDLGEYEAAIRVYESALKCQRDAKDLRGEAVSLLNIGLCHIERGAFDAARAPLEQALQVGERMRVPRTQAVGLTYLGLMQEGCAEWSQAAASYAAACQLRLTIGQEPLAIDALAGIVRVAVATGDVITARQRVDDILNWLATNGTDGIEYPIRVYVTLVHALRALGEIDRANVTLAEGLNVLAARAAQFSDPDLRRSFLEQVPFNHALMTLSGANAESPATKVRSVSPDGTSED